MGFVFACMWLALQAAIGFCAFLAMLLLLAFLWYFCQLLGANPQRKNRP